jgi:cation diffusion facilitator family transporter
MQGHGEGNYKLKALKVSATAIFSVVIVEVSVGLIVNSLAILSDGLHALLDTLSTIMLLFAIHASMKPPDEEHTYGHEKFETIGGLIGGIVLIAVAFLIFYEAAIRLMHSTQIVQGVEFVGFIAIAYSLFVASLRVTVFRKSLHSESSLMRAGLYDAIADLSSTLIALLGFALATLGFFYGDAVASIFLGIMLSYLSVKLVRFSAMELSDTASKEFVQKIKNTIFSHESEGVVKIGNLKVRKVSSKSFIEASVQVSSHMSLEEAHSLASKIEADLKRVFGKVDPTIHIEPSEKESQMDQLVAKLATVEGVKEVHEISTIYTDGKFYITLHAYVNPELSVEEGHKIAETIERRLHAEIKPLENVTVHIEPSSVAGLVAAVDEAHLRKIVNEVTKGIDNDLSIKRIVTYTAEGKRYINIDCCFTKEIQIKDAHKIASRVEKETKERFAHAIVTVHIEPQFS